MNDCIYPPDVYRDDVYRDDVYPSDVERTAEQSARSGLSAVNFSNPGRE